jgi:hypothetical protein
MASIINTRDGKASVSLYAKDGMVWANQNLKEDMIKGFVMDDERLENQDTCE